MNPFLILALIMMSIASSAQTDSVAALKSITDFQSKINAEFKDPNESPLEPKARKKFRSLPFFPANLAYRVTAKLALTEGTPFLQMKTTTTRLAMDRIYGYLEFSVAGKDFRMPVYQSQSLMNNPEYTDYLFFPFSDLTNGNTTYGGGRYIDLRIPKADTIIIDFNMAYNPSCAYNPKYSCPLVPSANQMDIEVPVGVMYEGH